MKPLVLLALAALPMAAQPVISAKSGVVSYTEGAVKLADQTVEATATNFPEVKENAVLRTEEGRAEVLLTMGVILRMGDNASLKMLTNRLIDTRMELISGSHIVEADEIQKDNNLTILAKEATILVNKKGLYRFDIDQNRIKVFDGVVSVEKNGQTILVGAGKMVSLDASSNTVEKFDKEATDALDRWARRRSEQLAMANPSSAKQVHDYGCAGMNGNGAVMRTNWAAVNNPGDPCYNPCGGWRYNPWYGLVTYIPCNANIYSPYGWRYYNPYNVMRVYYVPPAPVRTNPGYNANNMSWPSYNSMGQTSSGYSGTMSTSSVSVASSAAPAATSAGTSAGASGGSSAGHGGGHGGR
jgi:hypothetical protein